MHVGILLRKKVPAPYIQRAIPISPNEVAVATDMEGFIIDAYRGAVLKRVLEYGNVTDVHTCCGHTVFVDMYSGFHIISDSADVVVEQVHSKYLKFVRVLANCFISCDSSCACFSFSGKMYWSTKNLELDIRSRPAYYNEHFYIPNGVYQEVLILNSRGEVVNSLPVDGMLWKTEACKDRLYVLTSKYFYIYDINNPTKPKEIKTVENRGWIDMSLNSNCDHAVFANLSINGLTIVKLNDLQHVMDFIPPTSRHISSIEWRNDLITAGYGKELHVYSVSI